MRRSLLLCAIILVSLSSCSLAKYSSVNQNSSFGKYKYAYIMNTASVISSYSEDIKTTNPVDVIAGNLMKKGFVRIPEINQSTIDQTMIVSYGESGKHALGYSIEVTLQFLDAKTMDIIATSTAAGMGETDSDSISKAINKCFKNLFSQQ